jgi:hypothetical protein
MINETTLYEIKGPGLEDLGLRQGCLAIGATLGLKGFLSFWDTVRPHMFAGELFGDAPEGLDWHWKGMGPDNKPWDNGILMVRALHLKRWERVWKPTYTRGLPLSFRGDADLWAWHCRHPMV